MVPSQDAPASSVAFPQDATAGLEPLAVPFGRLITILRRHLWVVALSFVLGIGGMTFMVTQMPKQYTAETSILIEPQRTQVSDLQAISHDPGDVDSLVRTQMDILRSPSLQMSVVRELNLINNPEFKPASSGRLLSIILSPPRLLQLLQPKAERQPTIQDAIEAAAATLSGKIGFANEARSGVLRVQVTTHNAQLSARIANEMAKQFLDFKRQEKFIAMQRAHDWFQDQLGKLSEQTRTAQLEVEKYRQQHGLSEMSPSDYGGAALSTINRQQLDTVTRLLVEVARERALKEAQLAQAEMALRGKVPTSQLPEVVGSPLVTELQAQSALLAGREAQLAASQGDRNPELASVRAQLRKVQFRAQQEMATVANSLRMEVKAAQAQEQSLQRRMEELRVAVIGENSAQAGMEALQAKARATRTIYESFLNRATQLANVSGIQEPDASLVSSARPPLGPSSPHAIRLILVAAVLSIALGVALACVVERLRGGFGSPEQFEAHFGLPVVALVPKLSRRAGRLIQKDQSALAFTASLNNLRGQMRVSREGRPKFVMITSALPKEGKTVFAAGLARNAAAAGWHVLLIECDFGCPSLGAHFGLQPAPGLYEILTGGMLGDNSQAVREPEPRLNVILAGSRADNAQELLASERMTRLLDAVRNYYDLVIMDTPPVLPVADALVLSRHADATLFVVRWEKTARTAAQDAIRLLRDSYAHILGAAMTRVDLRAAAVSGGRLSYLYRYRNYGGYRITNAGQP